MKWRYTNWDNDHRYNYLSSFVVFPSWPWSISAILLFPQKVTTNQPMKTCQFWQLLQFWNAIVIAHQLIPGV